MTEPVVRGRCLCGGIAWQAQPPLELMSHCHCSMCRKAHGAAYATYVGVRRERFAWLGGEERIARFESAPGSFRCFCPTCGSVVPAPVPDAPTVFMPAGNLDDDPGVRPLAHIFVGSKAPWHEIADTVRRFTRYPPGWGEGAGGPPGDAPRPPSEPGIARGSCLCGAVAFEARGPFSELQHCHCSRDRKAVSAACATDFTAPADGFRWVRGAGRVRSFPLPDARWFVTAFCDACGSPMPHPLRSDPSRVRIHAGALDGDPGLRAARHVYVGSKAPWSEIGDDLPRFEERAPLP